MEFGGFYSKHLFLLTSLTGGQSGLRLSERLQDTFYYEFNGEIGISFQKIRSRVEFFESLEGIHSFILKKKIFPILHIDMHGNREGFQTSNDDFVTYASLLPYFRKINALMCNNFFIVAAACEGGYLSQIVQVDQESPFWGVLGPSRVVTTGVIEDAFQAFYEHFFADITSGKNNLSDSLQKLKDALPAEEAEKFRVINSEWLFGKIFRKYIKHYCTPDAIERRINNFCRQNWFQFLSGSDYESYRRQKRSALNDIPRQFERYKTVFFMLDRCPGNREQFKLSLADIEEFRP